MRTSQIIAAVALGWATAAVIVGGLLLDGHETAIERGRHDTATLALVLQENTARTIEAVNLALSATADDIALAPGLPNNDPGFQRKLELRLVNLPSARALFIVGPDGYVIQGTDFPSMPRFSLADRPYFKEHQADRSPRLAISPPLKSRSGLGWFLAVSRPIVRDGQFAGVVVAAVQPGYFEALYRRMQLRVGDVITLYDANGVIIATYPEQPERVGTSAAGRPPFTPEFADIGAGNYEFLAQGSGGRTAGFRRVEALPFVVEIARDKHAILSEWRRTASASAAAMLALTLLLTLLMTYLLRQHRLQEIARARRAQAEKLEALGLLTGGIAHDFGNLLNILSMNLHAMGMPSADPKMTQQSVAVARRAIEQGKGLIARLLAFAKQQPLDVRAAQLNTVVADAMPLLRQAAGSGVEISTELAQDLPPCLVDSNQLEVALVNLVANARDAMASQAGTTARIVLRTYLCTPADVDFIDPHTRGPGYVGMAVEDNGPGMSEDVRQRALEPFFTTKGSAGTGLGLAQVYGFMRQIGGSVRIDSELGSGTSVHLFFPIAGAEAVIPISSAGLTGVRPAGACTMPRSQPAT